MKSAREVAHTISAAPMLQHENTPLSIWTIIEEQQYFMELTAAFRELPFIQEIKLKLRAFLNTKENDIPPQIITEQQDLHQYFLVQTPSLPPLEPTILIKWLGNLQMFMEGNTAVLDIKVTYPEDTGTFTCRATNTAGQAETSAVLTVQTRSKDKPRGEPPKFLVPLQPVQVKHGSKVVLEATVRGQPTPRALWYHLHKEVAPSQEFVQEYDEATGRVSLTIREIFIDDKGLYRCVAVNEYGRDETASYVTVEDIEMLEKCELRQAPRIILPLQAQVVKTGSSLDLLARYEAFPPPTIKWYHQGKELKPSRDFIIEHTDDETSLHVEEVFEDDSGEYEVRVFNEAGEARSVATVLVIRPQEVIEMEPPKFIKPLQPQIVPEGEVAILEAEVTAKPEAVFQWYRHGQEITHDEELEVQITSENNKSTLVLGELFEDDSGDYTVAAENPVGRAASTATLLVEGEGAEEAEPPVFNPPLTPIRVMDGEEVRFSCKVTGKPMPKISWFQNGRPIGHHREVRLTQTPDGKAGLQILEVFPEDAGDYTCIARNKAGEARTTANLTVESYEYIPDSEQATVTSVSEKNVFSGSPSEADETLEIEKDSESDSEAGSSPYFCTRLEEKIEVMEGTSVRLITKANGYPRPTIKWYVDGAPVEVTESLTVENYEDGSAVLTLHKTTLDDCGVYTCEAMNRNGIDTTVTTLVVLEEEHTETTSKAYRKPEWVTRMEELKEQMSGIVERSRARRRCTQAQQSLSSKPAVGLQCSPKLISTPTMSQSATTIHPLAEPLMHSTPIMIKSSPSVLPSPHCVSKCDIILSPPVTLSTPDLDYPKSMSVSVDPCISVGLESASCNKRALTSSTTSTSATSMSIDSLDRPSISRDPSCMSSRDTISECDTEFGSHTEIDSRSDSQCTESQGDRLAQLEVASSLSIGDLSMGSDSVFISETETVSDGTSRRTSGYTINPIYFTEDQVLSISKSSLLSPNTKHVHFKFDTNTPSTTSEDERSTESPNFAQAVMTNYLSSHRNSISQVIEALSSLAQADITAEIEMTIEQNKKDKLTTSIPEKKSKSGEVRSHEIDPDSIPSIEITEPPSAVDNAVVVFEDSVILDASQSSKATEIKKKDIVINQSKEEQIVYPLSPSSSIQSNISTTEEMEIAQELSNSSQSTDEDSKSFLLGNQRQIKAKSKELPESQCTEKTEKDKPSKALSNGTKVQRKSILKNPTSKNRVAPISNQQGSNEETLRADNKVTRQLTPTPRRKPILKKESMVSSSGKSTLKKESSCDSSITSRKTDKESEPNQEPIKMMNRLDINSTSIPKISVKEQNVTHGSKSVISSGVSQEKTKKSSLKSSLDLKEESRKESDLCQSIAPPLTGKSVSAPTTPLLLRKERPSPPSKLPLVISRESSTDSLKESKIPRRVKSNESTPTTTPIQIRKFSLRNEETSTKIPKLSREHSSDSLTNWQSPKRNVWSEPNSPMSTPQLIRKTFKQIHEASKIPMPVYQYSSTEELEDSSPDSPRSSRPKRQRSLVHPPRAMSVDRAMDIVKRASDESPKPSRTSFRNQSPLPVLPRAQSPLQARVNSPTPAKVSSKVQSPTLERVTSPVHGKSQSPSQASSRVTTPGSTPRTVLSPGSTPRTVVSPGSTPKGLLSPASTPKSPASTPKRVKSPIPQSSLYNFSDALNKTGARPKITRALLFPVDEMSTISNPPKRSHSSSKYVSASDSEQHSTPVGSGRTKSSRSYKNGGLRRADSLEEFLLLENECMD